MANINTLRRGISQYEAGTGRRISPEALQALLAAELDVDASRQAQNKELELRQQALDSQIKQNEANAEAAKMSGLTQAAGTAVQGGILLKTTGLGSKIAPSIFGAAKPAAVSAGGELAGTAAGETAGATLSGPAVSGSAGAATGTEAGALTSGTTTAGESTGAASSLSPGIATAGWIAAAVAADQMLANRVGKFDTPQERWESNVRGLTRYGGLSPGLTSVLEKWTGMGKSTTGVERTIAAATSGTIPTWLGGSQKTLIPDLGQIADDAGTVICTEVARQGYLSRGIVFLDGEHRKANIDDETYAGYLKWAIPLVCLMRKSKIVSFIVRPFAIAWAYEMAHQVRPQIKGRLLGKILLKLGVPICKMIGSKKERCHA